MNQALLINSLCSATAITQKHFVNLEKMSYKSKYVVWSLLQQLPVVLFLMEMFTKVQHHKK